MFPQCGRARRSEPPRVSERLEGFDGDGVVAVGVVVLVFDGWDVPAGAVDSFVVVPVDPFCDGVLELVHGLPWSGPFDEFGFEQPNGGFGQCVVVGVSDAAN